jgi:hypothetical protein
MNYDFVLAQRRLPRRKKLANHEARPGRRFRDFSHIWNVMASAVKEKVVKGRNTATRFCPAFLMTVLPLLITSGFLESPSANVSARLKERRTSVGLSVARTMSTAAIDIWPVLHCRTLSTAIFAIRRHSTRTRRVRAFLASLCCHDESSGP